MKRATSALAPRRLHVALLLGAAAVMVAVLLLAAGANTSRVTAAGSDMRAARAEYPNIDGTQLDSCALCHVSDSNFGLDPYGDDYQEANGSFEDIEDLDSDGDGYDNITEINALTFPGKADSVPTGEPTTPAPEVTDTPTDTEVPPTTPPPETATATQTPDLTPIPDRTPTPESEHLLFVPWAYQSPAE